MEVDTYFYTEEEIKNLYLIDKDARELAYKQVEETIPDLYNYKTCLYIGANLLRQWFVEKLKDHECEIDLVEIFKGNCDYLKGKGLFNNIYNADIFEFNIEKKYDVIFWCHGIEHIQKEKFPKFMDITKDKYNKLLLLNLPYGNYTQQALYNNLNEEHISAWDDKELQAFGFQTKTYGQIDNRGELIAWIRK